jgi:hypothetical protein
MLRFVSLAIRQAQEALKNGRLEEAHRLLTQPAADGHKQAWEMVERLARAYVERGERQLRHDNPEPAWHDLLLAEQLQAAQPAVERLRKALVRLGLAEIRALLQTGDPLRAS